MRILRVARRQQSPLKVVDVHDADGSARHGSSRDSPVSQSAAEDASPGAASRVRKDSSAVPAAARAAAAEGRRPKNAGYAGQQHELAPSHSQPLLRCPAGHGLQWVREDRGNGKGPGQGERPPCAPAGDLRCSRCAGPVSGPMGFHCCALCFHDAGEQHVVCGACSLNACTRQQLAAPQPPGVRKSMSTGALRPLSGCQLDRFHKRQSAVASRAADWSLVSAAASQPTALPRLL